MVVFRKKCIKHKGFTFPEILIAMAVIVTFSAAAIIGGNEVMQNSRFNAAKAGTQALKMAISQYHFEVGSYPKTLNDLTVKSGSYGPWIDSDALKDPWNKDYVYSYNSSTNTFTVYSTGKTGNEKII